MYTISSIFKKSKVNEKNNEKKQVTNKNTSEEITFNNEKDIKDDQILKKYSRLSFSIGFCFGTILTSNIFNYQCNMFDQVSIFWKQHYS